MFYVSCREAFHSSSFGRMIAYVKTLALFSAGLLLVACGGGGSSESSEQIGVPGPFTTIQGSAMKGAVVNGIVQVYLIESQSGVMVESSQPLDVMARTNERGEYQLQLPGYYQNSNMVVEITADSQSYMTCDVTDGCDDVAYGELFPLSNDFSLKAAVVGVNSGETFSAYLSPLSHMAQAYASSNDDGLTSVSISNAVTHIETLMDLEQGAMQLSPADITDLERYTSLSKSEIELGVISAAFLSLVNTPDWGSIEEVLNHVEEKMSGAGQLASVNLGVLPDVTLDDLFFNATEISNDLLSLSVGGNHAETLSEVSAETNESYQNVSEVPQTVDPIIISTHPQSVTVDEGARVLFSVAVSGGGPLSFQWQKSGHNILGANGSSLAVDDTRLVDAGEYAVVVSNSVGSVVSFSALLTVEEVVQPIMIVSQPESLNILEMAQANFSVEVIGGGEISYQWRKNGVAIMGASNANLSLSSAVLSDAGSYDVVVSNSVSSVISLSAALVVNELVVIDAVSIITQPQGVEVAEGELASFSVVSEGGGELVYQWRKSGVVIAGATSASLSMSSTVLSDAGSYDVVVSNSAGSVMSLPAVLVVNEFVVIDPVSILSQPQALEVVVGEQADFSVVAEGGGELTYQWRKGGVAIIGATNSSLALDVVVLADAGLYDVVVTNSEGELASVSVSLGVNEVVEVLSSVQLTWDTPLKREDGADLELYEINGYVVMYGTDAGSLDQQVIVVGTETSVLIESLAEGVYYFSIATVDSKGNQGAFSAQIQQVIM